MAKEQPTIYFNAVCSKSNQTYDLLLEKGYEPTIVNYLEEAPTVDELKDIVKLLNLTPREILRTTEQVFKDAGLGIDELTDDDIYEAINGCPSLLQRPIVIYKGKAAIGRPAENILEILD